MKDMLFLAAMTLVQFGVIDIPTKNVTNTLNHTKCKPHSRVAIPENEQEAHDERCMNECKVVCVIPEKNNNFACFQYALEKVIGTIGFEEEINFPGRLFSIFIEDYFEQTNNPQPNDLVIYTYDKDELQMTHFGIVVGNGIIESKWGYSPEIRHHGLFGIPTTFGNAAWFYTLKKEYQGPKGNKKAIAAILKCLKLQQQILQEYGQ